MTITQEVKNFTAYRQQVLKLAKYVSLNKENLTLHLLVKSYKYVKALGRKYCDKTNNDLQANFADGMPDWSSKADRASLTLDDYMIMYDSLDHKHYRDYYQYTAIIDPYLVGILFNGDFRSDPKSYGSIVFKLGHKHGMQAVKEVGMHDKNATKYTIEDFINYLKVLSDILQLNINHDRKAIKKAKRAKQTHVLNTSVNTFSNKSINYKDRERKHARAIKNGKYNWNTIFN